MLIWIVAKIILGSTRARGGGGQFRNVCSCAENRPINLCWAVYVIYQIFRCILKVGSSDQFSYSEEAVAKFRRNNRSDRKFKFQVVLLLFNASRAKGTPRGISGALPPPLLKVGQVEKKKGLKSWKSYFCKRTTLSSEWLWGGNSAGEWELLRSESRLHPHHPHHPHHHHH